MSLFISKKLVYDRFSIVFYLKLLRLSFFLLLQQNKETKTLLTLSVPLFLIDKLDSYA